MANQNNFQFPQDPVAHMNQPDNKRKIKEGLEKRINEILMGYDWLNKTPEQRAAIRDIVYDHINGSISPFVFPVTIEERNAFINQVIDQAPALKDIRPPPLRLPSKSYSGGAEKYKYNNRTYTVRTGPRGGKYIVYKNKKIYI